ncbi:MAG: cobalamin biosynthesis protein CobD [Deltaproteobacteria bacterium]|nr:cobalamin biosynthesis protein CobD [Deltaproteobacteria bacterium]
MLELSFILIIGFFMDLIIGDPQYRYHPIRMIGNGIAKLERILRRFGLDSRGGGIILAFSTVSITFCIYLVITHLFDRIHPILGWCFNLFVFYSLLALQDLFHHIRPVNTALGAGHLPEARSAVARIVGRDVEDLNEQGIIRAAIETISENFVDGFLSPLFWFLVGGLFAFYLRFDPVPAALSLMLATKVASTLDSMVGYKIPDYLRFGWAGARLDDIMAFIPARLSVFILFLGAWVSGLRASTGFRVAFRDRLKHDSPNAAHAESFVAGALNVRLGGPTRYSGELKNKPWLGEEFPDPDAGHIRLTERLIRTSAWIFVLIVEGILAVIIICR